MVNYKFREPTQQTQAKEFKEIPPPTLGAIAYKTGRTKVGVS